MMHLVISPDDPCCHSCKFWLRDKGDKAQGGTCHRNAPSNEYDNPITHWTYWCGEYHPDEDTVCRDLERVAAGFERQEREERLDGDPEGVDERVG